MRMTPLGIWRSWRQPSWVLVPKSWKFKSGAYFQPIQSSCFYGDFLNEEIVRLTLWIETIHFSLNSTGIPYIKTISHSRTTRYMTAWGLNCKWLQWNELKTNWRRISFCMHVAYISLCPRCDANWLLTHHDNLCILLSTPALRRGPCKNIATNNRYYL